MFTSLCVKTIEIVNGQKKGKITTFLNVFSMFLKFWLKTYFDMCFDNLIEFDESHQ
jgi:hypothetical protein